MHILKQLAKTIPQLGPTHFLPIKYKVVCQKILL